jgi:hypothetical protein
MTTELQHTRLDGIADYVQALDTLCKLAAGSLCLFDSNFENTGFNSEARYETLRAFLLRSANNTLLILAHDTDYLAQRCPRVMMLLRRFSHNMHIHRTPQHLRHIAEPFAVADESHYVRRFHFDDTRGILAQNDPEVARTLHAQFMEIWTASRPAVSATTLGL